MHERQPLFFAALIYVRVNGNGGQFFSLCHLRVLGVSVVSADFKLIHRRRKTTNHRDTKGTKDTQRLAVETHYASADSSSENHHIKVDQQTYSPHNARLR